MVPASCYSSSESYWQPVPTQDFYLCEILNLLSGYLSLLSVIVTAAPPAAAHEDTEILKDYFALDLSKAAESGCIAFPPRREQITYVWLRDTIAWQKYIHALHGNGPATGGRSSVAGNQKKGAGALKPAEIKLKVVTLMQAYEVKKPVKMFDRLQALSTDRMRQVANLPASKIVDAIQAWNEETKSDKSAGQEASSPSKDPEHSSEDDEFVPTKKQQRKLKKQQRAADVKKRKAEEAELQSKASKPLQPAMWNAPVLTEAPTKVSKGVYLATAAEAEKIVTEGIFDNFESQSPLAIIIIGEPSTALLTKAKEKQINPTRLQVPHLHRGQHQLAQGFIWQLGCEKVEARAAMPKVEWTSGQSVIMAVDIPKEHLSKKLWETLLEAEKLVTRLLRRLKRSRERNLGVRW